MNNIEKDLDKDDIELILRQYLFRVLTTDIIYKYSDFDTAIDKILIGSTLRFRNPDEFNDPFDCHESLLKLNHKKEMVEEALNSSKLNLTREQRRKFARDGFKKEKYSPIIKGERNRFKLSCFSAKSNEVLMWSHYANSHRGICVGFNFPHKYDEKFILCPVKYLDRIIPLDGTSDVVRTILYLMTTKSERWKYEDEIRAVTKTKTSELIDEDIQFDRVYVKEIRFGCKVSKEKIKYALKKLKQNGFNLRNIAIKRMVINEDTFLLKEENIWFR